MDRLIYADMYELNLMGIVSLSLTHTLTHTHIYRACTGNVQAASATKLSFA